MTPYQGSYMWSTGHWSDGENLLTDLTLTLTSALPSNSFLDFKTFYDIETGWDYGYVQVSTNGGASWANLASTLTTTTNPNGQNLGNGITGTTPATATATDLSARRQTVMIRFRYLADEYVFGDGWYLDSLSVGPTGAPIFSDDVETLKPEWTTTSNRAVGWSR
jgi:immune inhibitor A